MYLGVYTPYCHGRQWFDKTFVLQDNSKFVLQVPYCRDDDLDPRMHELLGEISSEADDRNCFSESEARMEGTDRYW